MKTTYPFSRDLVAAVLDRYYSGVAMHGDEVHGESFPTQEQFAAKVAEYHAYQAQLASYQSALDAGFTDPILGVKLKTTKHAQEMFTALVTMLQEGITLQLITNDTEMAIWNYADEPVELTVLQIRQMLFRYGMHCKTFFDDYAP